MSLGDCEGCGVAPLEDAFLPSTTIDTSIRTIHRELRAANETLKLLPPPAPPTQAEQAGGCTFGKCAGIPELVLPDLNKTPSIYECGEWVYEGPKKFLTECIS